MVEPAPSQAPASGTRQRLSQLLERLDRQGRSGQVEVRSPRRRARVHIRKGYVVNTDVIEGAEDWALGAYLTESGTVDPADLMGAQRYADDKKMPLEDALLIRGLISEDVLKRFVDLQVQESLFPLFALPEVELEFLEERPRTPPLATSLPCTYVLKEADRRAELWPQLRRKVSPGRAVYKKDPALLPELLGYVESDGDDQEPLPEISASARVVFYHIDGVRTVSQVAKASGLGTFETFRALAELADNYLVELVTADGRGADAVRSQKSPMPTFVMWIAYVVLAGLLALGLQWVASNADRLGSSLTASSGDIAPVVEAHRLRAVEHALESYHLRHGTYPESLSVLATEGYLGRDARESISTLTYELTEVGYRLAREGTAADAPGGGPTAPETPKDPP